MILKAVFDVAWRSPRNHVPTATQSLGGRHAMTEAVFVAVNYGLWH